MVKNAMVLRASAQASFFKDSTKLLFDSNLKQQFPLLVLPHGHGQKQYNNEQIMMELWASCGFGSFGSL